MMRYPVSRRWTVVCILIVLAGAGSGCAKPSARLVGISVSEISPDSVTLAVDVDVTNPNLLPLPMANLDYKLASGVATFLSGEAPLEGAVPGMGSKTFTLPVTLKYAELLSRLKGVTPGMVVPYDAEVGLSVDLPVLGMTRFPLAKSGELPIPAMPKVSIRDIAWSTVSLNETAGVVTLNVENPNAFALNLQKLNYGLSLGGVEVAKSSLAEVVAFEANGGAGTVQIPITFSPKELGLGVLRMLGGSESAYGLSGTMAVDTPYGKMSLPINAIGRAGFKR
jgi:LEA14-like dessication related protein